MTLVIWDLLPVFQQMKSFQPFEIFSGATKYTYEQVYIFSFTCEHGSNPPLSLCSIREQLRISSDGRAPALHAIGTAWSMPGFSNFYSNLIADIVLFAPIVSNNKW